MAKQISADNVGDGFKRTLARLFQSGHINFLIGSGASSPAIQVAGTIESEIAELVEAGNDAGAKDKLCDLLSNIQTPTNDLVAGAENANNAAVLEQYIRWLSITEKILAMRRTTLLPKQANIFSTNYDLFIEKASVSTQGLRLNDGFSRVPSLDSRIEFSSRNFFNATYNTGNVYDYRVEIPAINLLKLHGSLSWKADGEDILFELVKHDALAEGSDDNEKKAFLDRYAVVLPQTEKFRTTLMNRTYYELLRIYANQLDRENSLLVVFGFSFSDEHIFDITKRALKNPTLKVLAFAFDVTTKDSFADLFSGYNNVDIIYPQGEEHIDFKRFNSVLHSFRSGAEIDE